MIHIHSKGEEKMNDLEQKLKEMIVSQYGSMKKFCETINMPWTTLDSILKRGIANSNISNVLKITKELNLDAEALVDGNIISSSSEIHTIAAHHEGEEWTQEELDEIEAFKKFVKSKRNNG